MEIIEQRSGRGTSASLPLFFRDEIKFVHSGTGIKTLKDEFDKVLWHNRQYVGDIEKALRSLQKQQLSAP